MKSPKCICEIQSYNIFASNVEVFLALIQFWSLCSAKVEFGEKKLFY